MTSCLIICGMTSLSHNLFRVSLGFLITYDNKLNIFVEKYICVFHYDLICMFDIKDKGWLWKVYAPANFLSTLKLSFSFLLLLYEMKLYYIKYFIFDTCKYIYRQSIIQKWKSCLRFFSLHRSEIVLQI